MSFTLDWNGRDLTAEISGICKKAVKESAESVAVDARRLVPVKTGGLRKTIDVVTFDKPCEFGAYVNAGGEKMGHIAGFVELGTPGEVYNYGKRKGGKRTPIEAKQYLRPALKKQRRRFLAAFKDKLK